MCISKEIAQDLRDTPVLEGGREQTSDLRVHSLAGPGALAGLQVMYKLAKMPTQAQAMPMMHAILEDLT